MTKTEQEDQTSSGGPRDTGTAERRSYVVGFFVALLLTLIPFAMVAWDLADRRTTLVTLGVAASLQVVAHFRWFLHIRLRGQAREDLHLILFTGLILALMVGGTIFILTNLAGRM